MGKQTSEYRLVWKREGRQRSTRIYQAWGSAYKKAQGILALEAVKGETSLATLPDLEEPPVIEVRPVGDWVPTTIQILEPHEGLKESMKFLYKPYERDANVPF